jgi:hypothetical protein
MSRPMLLTKSGIGYIRCYLPVNCSNLVPLRRRRRVCRDWRQEDGHEQAGATPTNALILLGSDSAGL